MILPGFARRAILATCALIATTSISLVAERPRQEKPDSMVDHRYAPTWWQTCICLPDDWQKTLVGKEGTLLYDYPGTYSGFKTRIRFGLGDGEKWVRQELVSARVPIVRTLKRAGAVVATEEAFAAAPRANGEARQPVSEMPLVQRLDGSGEQKDWAHPTVSCDPMFRDAAIGLGRSIHYRVRAAEKGPYTVVFGLCEGWYATAGQRILDLKIEGRIRKTINMVALSGQNAPAVFPFEARDENGDGWIDLEVAAAARSVDKNTVLNVLWVFKGTAPAAAKLVSGESRREPLAKVHCGLESPVLGPPRQDVLVLHLRNTSDHDVSLAPIVMIESEQKITVDPVTHCVRIGAGTTLHVTRPFQQASSSKGKVVLQIRGEKIPAGQERTPAIGVLRGVLSPSPSELSPQCDEEAVTARAARRVLAEGRSALRPHRGPRSRNPRSDRFVHPQHLPGPGNQEGPAGIPGRSDLLPRSLGGGRLVPDGVGRLPRPSRRSAQRHPLPAELPAQRRRDHDHERALEGDGHCPVGRHPPRAPHRRQGMADRGLAQARARLGLYPLDAQGGFRDPKAPNYGLIPEGFADGGLGGTHPEYTNIYWTLVGMKAAVDAARRLGKSEEAARWQQEYDDFYAAFCRAAQRDTRTDSRATRMCPSA